MDNKVKNVLLLVLVIGLVGMTSAYAILQTSFSISSAATVKGATWNVHLANLSAPSLTPNTGTYKPTGTTSSSTPAATLTNTAITNIEATFTAPNQSVSYTFDVVNEGTLNARLANYVISSNTGTGAFTCSGAADSSVNTAICGAITYSLKQGSTDIANGRVISAPVSPATSTTETWTLTISLGDVDNANWPGTDVTVSGMNINFDFVQE